MAGSLWELTGDYAGGRVLGAEVVRATYDYLFRGDTQTILSQMLMEKLAVPDREELMEEIVSRVADNTMQTKDFASLLFDAAVLGDKVALDILSASGKQCARDVLAVAKELDFSAVDEIPVVLLGSIYTKAKHPAILDALQAYLDKYGKFKLSKLQYEPVTGAVCWAFAGGNVPFDKDAIGHYIDNMKHT